jgi:WD40 repeat protein
MYKTFLLALLVLALLFPTLARGDQPAKPDQQEISRLLHQLGSAKGSEQEAAAAALQKIGVPALKALTEVADKNLNPDVSSRAQVLARLLQPHPDQVWCNYAGPWDQRLFFHAQSYGVESVVFSPDGRQIATTGGTNGNLRLWDVTTGIAIRRIEVERSSLRNLVYSHAGRYLAAVDVRGEEILVWEAMNGSLVRRIKVTRDDWNIAFSQDDKQLISAGETVRWWNLQNGKEVRSFQLKNFYRFWGLASDGRLVMGEKKNKDNFSAGSLIDTSTGKEVVHFPFGQQGENTPGSVAYAPDGKTLIFSGRLRLRDAHSGKDIVEFNSKPFPNDAKKIAKMISAARGTGSAEEVVNIEKELLGYQEMRSAVDVRISPDGRRLLTAHGGIVGPHGIEFALDCRVRLWDLKTGNELRCFSVEESPVATVAFSPNGRYAASGSNDGTLRLWKLPE